MSCKVDPDWNLRPAYGASDRDGVREQVLRAVHHAVYFIILCMIARLCLTIRCMQVMRQMGKEMTEAEFAQVT